MLRSLAKGVVLVLGSAVAVPYTLAFLMHLLYGWGPKKDRYKRAFHPKRVLAMNYAILQNLASIRYVALYFKWKYFYYYADRTMLLKEDISYGTNENTLDLYLPETQASGNTEQRPIIVFVYGGTWGSGDKSMYGLVCSQLADKYKALVCCPNYSIYPKGYVDDMVQDIVDCIKWLHANGSLFGGNKEHIMLMGHSAGAHLVVMGVLELVMKRLLHEPHLDPHEISLVESSMRSLSLTQSLKFEERHFDGSSNDSGDASNGNDAEVGQPLGESANSGSFFIVDGNNREQKLPSEPQTESFLVVPKEAETSGISEQVEEAGAEQTPAEGATETMTEETAESKEESSEKEAEPRTEQEEGVTDEEVFQKSKGSMPMEPRSLLKVPDDSNISESQREVRDLLWSIRAVVGLAGVYHIGKHYKHETYRGIEDVSTMARAMYGPDHFDRFSPEVIVTNLPNNIRLPPMVLLHGDQDTTVPLSAMTSFSEVLQATDTEVMSHTIPKCGHVDICLDLMDPTRTFYDPIMTLISNTVENYL